ncbi:hypothetical protein E2C01_097805 [Portunus trituberculatus]|uniref:Uncharacterized protein n=1 Tax=Portunus trituberculatus TaxID=210409 RepID=A0A5B7KCC0_PORTR|nr:hypothetical protein [Portunus trituberculatus]
MILRWPVQVIHQTRPLTTRPLTARCARRYARAALSPYHHLSRFYTHKNAPVAPCEVSSPPPPPHGQQRSQLYKNTHILKAI